MREWLDRVVIVLCRPEGALNVGATCRAMKTMGMSSLYLVEPKHFPDADATARASGADDLLAAADIVLGAVAFELLPGATDGETLFIEQTANLADHDNVLALIVAAVAPALQRLQLGKLLLPVAQDMGFNTTQLTDFTNGEIALAWNRR